MIDNATRAAWDAIYRDRATLGKIAIAAESLALEIDPDTDPGHALLALAGDAWAHGADALDVLEAGAIDGQLPTPDAGIWLTEASQIMMRAHHLLP